MASTLTVNIKGLNRLEKMPETVEKMKIEMG